VTEQAAQRLRVAAAWTGPLFAMVLFTGWGLVAGMILPPWSPSDTPAEVADAYAGDTGRIRVGMLLLMLSALFAMIFTAAICHHLRELEGRSGILSWTAGLGGAAVMVLTFYPATFWLVAAYRPDRNPELTQLINDIAWLQFIGGVTIFLALPIAVMLASFLDQRARPVFPRWLGYYSLWTMLLVLPDQLLFFFHDGPFAWNGLFGLWIPAASFGGWFLVVFVVLRRAESVPSERAVPAGAVPVLH
jgi:hypothetical protein